MTAPPGDRPRRRVGGRARAGRPRRRPAGGGRPGPGRTSHPPAHHPAVHGRRHPLRPPHARSGADQQPRRPGLLATIGLVLLLFHLGLEFSLDDLAAGGRKLLLAGGFYLALNIGLGLALGHRARVGRAGDPGDRRHRGHLVVGHRHQAAGGAAPPGQPRDRACCSGSSWSRTSSWPSTSPFSSRCSATAPAAWRRWCRWAGPWCSWCCMFAVARWGRRRRRPTPVDRRRRVADGLLRRLGHPGGRRGRQPRRVRRDRRLPGRPDRGRLGRGPPGRAAGAAAPRPAGGHLLLRLRPLGRPGGAGRRRPPGGRRRRRDRRRQPRGRRRGRPSPGLRAAGGGQHRAERAGPGRVLPHPGQPGRRRRPRRPARPLRRRLRADPGRGRPAGRVRGRTGWPAGSPAASSARRPGATTGARHLASQVSPRPPAEQLRQARSRQYSAKANRRASGVAQMADRRLRSLSVRPGRGRDVRRRRSCRRPAGPGPDSDSGGVSPVADDRWNVEQLDRILAEQPGENVQVGDMVFRRPVLQRQRDDLPASPHPWRRAQRARA